MGRVIAKDHLLIIVNGGLTIPNQYNDVRKVWHVIKVTACRQQRFWRGWIPRASSQFAQIYDAIMVLIRSFITGVTTE